MKTIKSFCPKIGSCSPKNVLLALSLVDRTSASDAIDSGSIPESLQGEDLRKLAFRAAFLLGVQL